MPEGCSLRSLGSAGGGPPVSALSFVASAPSEVALCGFVLGCFCCFLFMGLRQHGTQVVICMRQDDTKLSTLASTDFTHKLVPITALFCGCWFFGLCFVFCVGCFCLCLLFVLFLLLGFCVSVLVFCYRDKGIGLCTGPLPVYFCGHYSLGP